MCVCGSTSDGSDSGDGDCLILLCSPSLCLSVCVCVCLSVCLSVSLYSLLLQPIPTHVFGSGFEFWRYFSTLCVSTYILGSCVIFPDCSNCWFVFMIVVLKGSCCLNIYYFVFMICYQHMRRIHKCKALVIVAMSSGHC